MLPEKYVRLHVKRVSLYLKNRMLRIFILIKDNHTSIQQDEYFEHCKIPLKNSVKIKPHKLSNP